jgi:hypothetical protein
MYEHMNEMIAARTLHLMWGEVILFIVIRIER